MKGSSLIVAASAVAVLCGAIGIVGWLFEIRGLLSIPDGAPGLSPLSAVGLVAAGAALMCAVRSPRSMQLLGLVVLAIFIVAAAGYMTGSSFGLGDLRLLTGREIVKHARQIRVAAEGEHVGELVANRRPSRRDDR